MKGIPVRWANMTTHAAILCGLLSAYCGGADPTGAKADTTIASIVLSQNDVLVGLGGTFQVSAYLSNATGKLLSDTTGVSWISSNPSLVAVDANGNMRGVALGGPVIVTASKAGKSATATVTVGPETVAISPPVATLAIGQSVQLSATARDFSGTTIDAGAVIWSAVVPSVATVTPTGLVTAVGPGIGGVTASIGGRRGSDNLGVPSVYDGTWAGGTNSAVVTPVQFSVLYGTITIFALPSVVFPPCAPFAVSAPVSGPIANAQFSFGVSQPVAAPATSGSVSGTFTSTSTASGNYVLTFSNLSCGGLQVGQAGPFSATKQ